MMRIAMLTHSVSRNAGGLFYSVRGLARHLPDDAQTKVLGLDDEFAEDDLPGWEPLETRALPVTGPRALGYAPGMTEELDRIDPDIVDCHGIWMYPSWACLRWARKSKKPYIVSPHGMLDPWAVSKSRWKKRLVGWLYQHAHFRGAACFRALCTAEAIGIRQFGLRNPVCVIPNGIDLPAPEPHQPAPWDGLVGDGRKALLYLGRIHPKKGLKELIQGWALLHDQGHPARKDWFLAICGWDQNGHEAELKALARQLGVVESVRFLGPQFDDAKAACYRFAEAFVLPSYSEGVPMVVLEAWSYGLPVAMTPECNLPDGFSQGAALEISNEPRNIARSLGVLMSATDAQRKEVGARGKKLVESRFNWNHVASQMRDVYHWLLGGGQRPDCVVG